ncbi:MAG: iron donor protein CyaY [Bryobacteraceae bacterium]
MPVPSNVPGERFPRVADELRRTKGSGYPYDGVSNMLDDQQFSLKADESLRLLYRALGLASDEYGFETDYGGTLTVEFEDPPAKFVVSPNSPVRQIWVSAHSKSFKLDWNDERSEFVLRDTSQSLKELIQEAVSQQLGEPVTL